MQWLGILVIGIGIILQIDPFKTFPKQKIFLLL